MRDHFKKIAVSGTVSAVFLSGFLYFVYSAEGAKYEEKKTMRPVKEYDETVITQVNTEVANATQGLASAKHLSLNQPQRYTPPETTEPVAHESAESQTAQMTPISSPETYVATSIPQIPSITIPSIPVSENIPSIAPITPIAIPKVPAPQHSPTINPTPVAPTQPRPTATQPRTTVS